ncbi:MAG: hypothetical protein R2759_03580 [Bacteroidales bacterium]
MEDNLFASVDQQVAAEKQESYYDTLLHKRQRPEKVEDAPESANESNDGQAQMKKGSFKLKPIAPSKFVKVRLNTLKVMSCSQRLDQ